MSTWTGVKPKPTLLPRELEIVCTRSFDRYGKASWQAEVRSQADGGLLTTGDTDLERLLAQTLPKALGEHLHGHYSQRAFPATARAANGNLTKASLTAWLKRRAYQPWHGGSVPNVDHYRVVLPLREDPK